MDTTENCIRDHAVETIARSFFKESYRYGFEKIDYLRFINRLLDISMNDHESLTIYNKEGSNLIRDHEEHVENYTAVQLPVAGKRIIIRAFEPDQDYGILENWLSDNYGRYFNISRTTGKKISIDSIISDNSNIIGLITLKDYTPIGIVAFLDYDNIQKKAELRKLIGATEMREKGLAKEATRLWIKYGVSAMGLNKIYLNTLDANIRNIKLNESLGFKIEGILRNEAYFDGEYHDILRMGLWTAEIMNTLDLNDPPRHRLEKA